MPSSARQGPVGEYLADDHDRLGALLDRALADPSDLDIASYEAFRAGLLRHIGLEEKMLFPMVRRDGDAPSQRIVERLHQEHALFAAMLVPTPTHEILSRLREMLVGHNAREEGPDGLYAAVDRLAADGAPALAVSLREGPEARVAPHFDTELVHENIRVLLRALDAGALREQNTP